MIQVKVCTVCMILKLYEDEPLLVTYDIYTGIRGGDRGGGEEICLLCCAVFYCTCN